MVEQRLAATEDSTVRAGFSISSQVLPSLIAALDTFAILSVALVSFLVLVGSYPDDTDHYVTAVCFVWLVALMLMHFAGLYQLEPIMRPLGFVDKLLVAFVTTVLFLLAAGFALKVSADFSRLWMGTFAAGAFAATLTLRAKTAASRNRTVVMKAMMNLSTKASGRMIGSS